MIKIALLIPSTSRNKKWLSYNDTYINTVFIHSFLKTYTKEYDFTFYFGFDSDDYLYTSDTFKKQMVDSIPFKCKILKNIHIKKFTYSSYIPEFNVNQKLHSMISSMPELLSLHLYLFSCKTY
jgi:hypothetical protein